MSSPLPVLLVENSRTARAVLTEQIEAGGYTVEAVSLGSEAIIKVQDHNYYAVIMDIFMPQMNGHEAAKHIRDLGITVPIVALTGSQDPRDKKAAIESGMDAFVNKSDDLADLFEALEALKNR